MNRIIEFARIGPPPWTTEKRPPDIRRRVSRNEQIKYWDQRERKFEEMLNRHVSSQGHMASAFREGPAFVAFHCLIANALDGAGNNIPDEHRDTLMYLCGIQGRADALKLCKLTNITEEQVFDRLSTQNEKECAADGFSLPFVWDYQLTTIKCFRWVMEWLDWIHGMPSPPAFDFMWCRHRGRYCHRIIVLAMRKPDKRGAPRDLCRKCCNERGKDQEWARKQQARNKRAERYVAEEMAYHALSLTEDERKEYLASVKSRGFSAYKVIEKHLQEFKKRQKRIERESSGKNPPKKRAQ